MATITTTGPTVPTIGQRLSWAVADGVTMTYRNLLRYIRIPTLLAFSTIQPVMILLLFNYVFGGAIAPRGLDYIDFLVPGVLVQVSLFGSTQTAVGLAEDLSKGLVERFRSLPMARSAVLAGRTASDTVRNLFVVMLISGVGYLLGFRFQGGVAATIAAVILAVLFGLAFSWVMAYIGLLVKDVESAQAASFVFIFPIVFVSSAFVPVTTMPGWLQAYAEISPVTVTVDALRDLSLAGEVTSNLAKSLAWIAGLLVAFVPLSVRQYRRVV